MNYHPPKCSITWNVEASLIKSAMKHSEPYHGEEKRFASLSRSLYSATGTKNTTTKKPLLPESWDRQARDETLQEPHTKKKTERKNIIVRIIIVKGEPQPPNTKNICTYTFADQGYSQIMLCYAKRGKLQVVDCIYTKHRGNLVEHHSQQTCSFRNIQQV